ncbi:MAG: tetratricopeptide repeat protein [Caulobacteraceae bacterium]|nr:tetratricopeptide repeat protein [Caulobacteraceae bacterium]
MVDLFEEVEEQLRSDRYLATLRRWAPWITGVLAAALLGYLGYWGFRLYQERNLNAAGNAYQAGLDALAAKNTKGALAQFQTAAAAGTPAYKALALIQQGGLKAAAGDEAGAAALFDAAAKAAPNPILADLASLRAADVLLDTAPYPQIQTRLQPLAQASRPFAPYAKEALAMAKIVAGKTAAARSDLSILSIGLDTPKDVQERAKLTLALIDSGDVATALAAARAGPAPPPPAGAAAAQTAPAPAGAAQ